MRAHISIALQRLLDLDHELATVKHDDMPAQQLQCHCEMSRKPLQVP